MFASVLLTAVLAIGAAAQDLTIITPVPGAAECQPFLIKWSGGTPPYFVTVENNPPSGTPFINFGQQSGTQLTWLVNATLGTSLLFQIKDNTGLSASSAAFTITSGSGDSCIGAGGAGGGTPGSSTTGGAPPTSPASTPGATGASTPATGGSTTKASGSTTSAKTSGSASNTPSAAQAVGVPAGVFPAFVAVLGAGLIAVLA